MHHIVTLVLLLIDLNDKSSWWFA